MTSSHTLTATPSAQHEGYSSKREPLHLDPTMFTTPAHNNGSRSPSPKSAGPGYSPVSQDNLSSAQNSGSEDTNSFIGLSRLISASSANLKKEKRKRSRVTPEQLVQLERLFLLDRSPPAARRREISDHLGMHERQTQIWFQNRCVKWSPLPLLPLIASFFFFKARQGKIGR